MQTTPERLNSAPTPLTEVNMVVAEKAQEGQALREYQAATGLGPAALGGVEKAAQAFYGPGNFQLERPRMAGTDGDIRLAHAARATTELGDGSKAEEQTSPTWTPEATLMNTLEGMRSLETVTTEPLLRMPMQGEQQVDFTALEHYAPKIAPSTEAYPIPANIEGIMKNDTSSDGTYSTTKEVEGWENQTFDLVNDYMATESGAELKERLKITDLSALTPEQATKLSVALVQNVSKYSHHSVENRVSVYDKSSTMQLLADGMQNKDDPNWKGNGVCRNVASNVKSVFEAVKANQQDLSMLRNTYVLQSGGERSAYNTERTGRDEAIPYDRGGHAWNTFVTIDATGSASITKVDATWALEKDADSALDHMDYTFQRSAEDAITLLAASSEKQKALPILARHYEGMILGGKKRMQTENFATDQYLKAADIVATEHGMIESTPPPFVGSSAHRQSSVLDRSEIGTLYALSGSPTYSSEQFKTTLGAYITAPINSTQAQKGRRLLFQDDTLQKKVFELAGEERLADIAENDGAFRSRVRELQGEALPAFDPENLTADQHELRHFAETYSIQRDPDPARQIKEFHNRLRRVAGNDESYAQAVAGRDDYDLIKNFGAIVKELKQATR